MLLQNTEIDGSMVQINSHGHHHRGSPSPREEVILCSVLHFPRPERAIQKLQAKFENVRVIWHTLKDLRPVDHDGIIPEGRYRQYPRRFHVPSHVPVLTS